MLWALPWSMSTIQCLSIPSKHHASALTNFANNSDELQSHNTRGFNFPAMHLKSQITFSRQLVSKVNHNSKYICFPCNTCHYVLPLQVNPLPSSTAHTTALMNKGSGSSIHRSITWMSAHSFMSLSKQIHSPMATADPLNQEPYLLSHIKYLH